MWLIGSACALHGAALRAQWKELGKKTDRSEYISNKEETDRRIAVVEGNFSEVNRQMLELSRQNGENHALILQAIAKIDAVQVQSITDDKHIRELVELHREKIINE